MYWQQLQCNFSPYGQISEDYVKQKINNNLPCELPSFLPCLLHLHHFHQYLCCRISSVSVSRYAFGAPRCYSGSFGVFALIAFAWSARIWRVGLRLARIWRVGSPPFGKALRR